MPVFVLDPALLSSAYAGNKRIAFLIGDIKANSISVEEGAYFKGSIELNREPHRKADLAKKPIEMPTPKKDKASVTPLDDAGKKS